MKYITQLLLGLKLSVMISARRVFGIRSGARAHSSSDQEAIFGFDAYAKRPELVSSHDTHFIH
jgi:hypothetical protein